MSDLSIPHLQELGTQVDPAKLRRALQAVQSAINNMGQQGNSSPVGTTPAPQPHTALSVKGGAGMVDVQMQDATQQYRGNENFFDYSTDGGKNWQTKHVGAANNWRGYLGKGSVTVRSYTQYPTSAPSSYLNHAAVDTTGDAEPEFQANAGSGTGEKGWGEQPYTGDVPPKRA